MDHKKKWNRVYHSQPWRKDMAHLNGSHMEVKAECRQRGSGPETHYNPWVEGFGVGGLRLDWAVQFSRSVMSDSLRPHGLQHARPPCPSPAHGVYSNSHPSHQWCHPTISSSVVPFSSCLQSFPASGFFQMSQFFVSGGQSTGVSASASVLPMNIQDWFPSEWTGWISLVSRNSQESSPIPQLKSINSSMLSFLYSPNLTSKRDHWKNHSFD